MKGDDAMPANLELKAERRKRLFQLLELKKLNKGIKIEGIEAMIIRAEAEMEEEDVAWVEKKISQLFPND
jgi:hypothetical protein